METLSLGRIGQGDGSMTRADEREFVSSNARRPQKAAAMLRRGDRARTAVELNDPGFHVSLHTDRITNRVEKLRDAQAVHNDVVDTASSRDTFKRVGTVLAVGIVIRPAANML